MRADTCSRALVLNLLGGQGGTKDQVEAADARPRLKLSSWGFDRVSGPEPIHPPRRLGSARCHARQGCLGGWPRNRLRRQIKEPCHAVVARLPHAVGDQIPVPPAFFYKEAPRVVIGA